MSLKVAGTASSLTALQVEVDKQKGIDLNIVMEGIFWAMCANKNNLEQMAFRTSAEKRKKEARKQQFEQDGKEEPEVKMFVQNVVIDKEKRIRLEGYNQRNIMNETGVIVILLLKLVSVINGTIQGILISHTGDYESTIFFKFFFGGGGAVSWNNCDMTNCSVWFTWLYLPPCSI